MCTAEPNKIGSEIHPKMIFNINGYMKNNEISGDIPQKRRVISARHTNGLERGKIEEKKRYK